MNNFSHNRRAFLIKISAASAALSAGPILSGCATAASTPEFNYGVASGDPLSDRVILWTHAQFDGATSPVELTWEVATDNSFSTIVSSGTTNATEASNFTAKVDATGLQPDTAYFYRFRHGQTLSGVGKTRTLPTGAVTQVKMAVMSCANYPAGYFHVYGEVAKSDVAVALHLGDYIYEYESTGYASQDAVAMGRVVNPTNELLTLADYRKRHAQYKSDPDLKNFHASKPLIAVWDDHEVANDAYKTGAGNHQAAEGDYLARRTAAFQAYHEWMPIRTGSDPSKIYRSFDFGNLLSLHMLDTRHLGRDKQLDEAALAGLLGTDAQNAELATMTSLSRQMLGTTQEGWLQTQMASSSATWQVLGQQVVMARIEFPVSILSPINTYLAYASSNPTAAAAALTSANTAITDYIVAKNTPAAYRTAAQTNLMNTSINPKLGYNLDAWDGYPVARETLLQTALALKKKLVVLAGDTHNAWHSNLTTLVGNLKAGEEFATSSVSSPGLEEYLPLSAAQTEATFKGVVDDLQWMDASRRGYLKMTFTSTTATGEWYFVNTVKNKTYTASAPVVRTYTP